MKVLLLLMMTWMSAISVPNAASLYDIDMPVTASDQPEIYRQALQHVIDKLTPGPSDHENPIINAANPGDFIASAKKITPERLQIRFKPDAIHKLMITAGQPPWHINHPVTLTWVCHFTYPVLRCLKPDEHPELFNALKAEGQKKGLTLEFPPNLAVTSYHVDSPHYKIHTFAKYLWKVATPLKPQAVLLIRLSGNPEHNDNFEQWQLYYQGKFKRGTLFEHPTSAVGAASMPEISQFMFEQGEKIKKTAHAVMVSVDNIQNADDYYQVERYLKNIPGVMKATLNSVTEDAVLYTLDVTIPTRLLHMRLAKTYISQPKSPDEDILNYRLTT